MVEYFVSAQTSNPDACWAWIKFLLDQPLAAINGAPARQVFLETPEFATRVGDDVVATSRFSLANLAPVQWRVNYWLHDAFDAILDGASPDIAIEEALAKDEAFRACLEGVSSSLQEDDIATCKEEADSLFP
jgi:hypothetical protein